MKKTLAFTKLDGFMVVVHGADPPAQADWDRYMEAWLVYHEGRSQCRVLIVSDGGAPTSAQQYRMKDQIREMKARSPGSIQTARAAILSESVFTRLVVNSIAAMLDAYRVFIGSGGWDVYRMFGKNDIRSALTWLELPASVEAAVRKAITQLRSELAKP